MPENTEIINAETGEVESFEVIHETTGDDGHRVRQLVRSGGSN
ncbi:MULTISPECIES: hypothetical protein [Haloferax]|nr:MULTISPECIES: hypothetical protein [Haloferax]